ARPRAHRHRGPPAPPVDRPRPRWPRVRSRSGPRVTPFWAPQSAVFVADPTALATPTLLALLLKGGSPVTLIYAGDRMEPAIRHGQRVVVDPVRGGEAPASGAVVLARLGGIPDLLRVEGASGGWGPLAAAAPEG